MKTTPYRYNEDRKILNFWADYVNKPSQNLSIAQLWNKFIRKTNSRRTVQSLSSRFQKYLGPQLWQIKEFGFKTRVKMIFHGGIPVEGKFLTRMRQNGKVETDKRGHITYYKEKERNGMKLGYAARSVSPSDDDEEEKEKDEKEEEMKKKKSGKRKRKLDEDDVADDLELIESPLKKSNKITTAEIDEESDDSLIMKDPEVIPRPIPITPLKKERDLTASNEMEVMVTSLKEMFTSQTCLMRQLVQQRGTFGTTATTSSSAQSSGSVQVLEQNSSKKAFLYLLRGIVLGMDHPELDHIVNNII